MPKKGIQGNSSWLRPQVFSKLNVTFISGNVSHRISVLQVSSDFSESLSAGSSAVLLNLMESFPRTLPNRWHFRLPERFPV